MVDVTLLQKNAYKDDRNISIEIRLPELPSAYEYIPDASIVMDTMQLKESLSESDSIEFVGCISSQFQVQLNSLPTQCGDLKGKKIYVNIKSNDTEAIPLFHGYIDDVQMAANKNYKTITAYDELYVKGNRDIAYWYNSLTFPITIRELRESLFRTLGITQKPCGLIADNIEITKQYSPKTLKALYVIKSICQINGVFGIINRQGLFEYRDLAQYESTFVPWYKGLEFQEYDVNPVDKITIRQSSNDEGVSFGSGENTYIIQNNFFTYNMAEGNVSYIAEQLLNKIGGVIYKPFKSDNDGYPWVEVGDMVGYYVYDFVNSSSGSDVYVPMEFICLNRTMSGIKALKDSYSASGDEYQREFITDLQSVVDTIATQVEEMEGKLQNYLMSYVLFANTQDLTLGDGVTREIANTRFSASTPVQALLQVEYLMDIETTDSSTSTHDIYNDCVLTLNYYLDDLWIDSRQPKETYQDGKHILSAEVLLTIQDTASHVLSVSLSTVGGKVTILQYMGQHILIGQGLIGDVWSGAIEAEDNFSRFTFNLLKTFTDSADVSTHTPVSESPADNFNKFTFNFLKTFTDTVSATKDFVRAYNGDGTSTVNCGIDNGVWKGNGSIVTTDVNNTVSVEVVQEGIVEYQVSFDGGRTWRGYLNGVWELDGTMTKAQLEAVRSWDSSTMRIKAILGSDVKVSSIQFNGGTLNV